MERTNGILIDWLSVTSKTMTPLDFMVLLGMNTGWQQLRGVRGYASRYYRDSISIHFGGREDMGTWLEMSGAGCRAFETFSDGDYDLIFDKIMSSPDDMNLTRLDVAYDSYDKTLDISRLCADTRAQKYVSKSDFWEVIESSKGKSLQVGSPASLVLVRIYDKLAERLAKVKNDADRDKLVETVSNWVRIELQLRDERAVEFVRYLQAADPVTKISEEKMPLGQVFAGVLQNYVDYGYSTAARGHPEQQVFHRFPYWQNVIRDAASISIYRKPGMEYNLQRMDAFVANGAGNAIDAALQIHGIGHFLDLISKRRIKQNPKYLSLIKEHGTFASKEEQIFVSSMEKTEYTDRTMLFLNHNGPVYLNGTRYLMCPDCGRVLPDVEFNICGGASLENFAVCRTCANKKDPEKMNIEEEKKT